MQGLPPRVNGSEPGVGANALAHLYGSTTALNTSTTLLLGVST